MRKYTASLLIVILSLGLLPLFSSCNSTSNKSQDIVVSILPIKYIAQEITGGDFNIDVLVPDGASPETYSPSSSQMAITEKAAVVFVTGLVDFEVELTKRLSNSNIAILSEGVALSEGSCGHASHSHHNHGIDPHIWTSPEQLKIMALNAYNAISVLYPDSVKYESNYNALLKKLNDCSDVIAEKIASSGKRSFMIYHPALTYYARDYGIEQISLETEGKEPSITHMAEIIAQGRRDSIKYVLYQKQFSRSVVETVSKDLGAEPVEINPLKEDILSELLYMTDVITK